MIHDPQINRIRQKVAKWPQYFRLQSVAVSDFVETVEIEYNFTLPSEYRQFLLEVGDGGEIEGWPFYTLAKALSMVENLVSQPFPYTGVRALDEVIEDGVADEYGGFPILGGLPLYYYGCTHSDLLVVTGPQAGTIWYDGRGIDFGFLPYTQAFSHPMSNPRRGQPLDSRDEQVGFLDWYEKHLDKAEQPAT